MNRQFEDLPFSQIKIGDKIRAKKIGRTGQHLLNCNDGFKIDLSFFVTVWEDKKGLLMAGKISLSSYKNRKIELLKDNE